MENCNSHSSKVQSVEKALSLVNLLANEGRPMSLTEIASHMKWPKSTTHNLLTTLRDFKYVEQVSSTGHYVLGVRLFELGNQVSRNWNIHEVAIPVMQRLNKELGEMVQLATEDNGEVLYIHKVDSTHMMRIVSDVGARLPMHCTGLGKVLLAYKPHTKVRWILSQKGMPSMTARTITSQSAMEVELNTIRRRGYAVDDQEIMESLRCIAAPVFEGDNQVNYAISVSGFANSLQGDKLAAVTEAVVQAASEISYAMGYRKSV